MFQFRKKTTWAKLIDPTKANKKTSSRSSSLVIAIRNDLERYFYEHIGDQTTRHSIITYFYWYFLFILHKLLLRLQPVIVPVVISSSIDFFFNSLPIIITFSSKPLAIILMMCKQMTYSRLTFVGLVPVQLYIINT